MRRRISLRKAPALKNQKNDLQSAVSQKDYKIVIGSKKYSSWSLRGWLGVRIIAGKNNFDEEFCQAPGVVSDPAVNFISFLSI
jgi:hypothetical protein